MIELSLRLVVRGPPPLAPAAGLGYVAYARAGCNDNPGQKVDDFSHTAAAKAVHATPSTDFSALVFAFV
jgi:hypothetical protein